MIARIDQTKKRTTVRASAPFLALWAAGAVKGVAEALKMG
jgi:hypothetical protein